MSWPGCARPLHPGRRLRVGRGRRRASSRCSTSTASSSRSTTSARTTAAGCAGGAVEGRPGDLSAARRALLPAHRRGADAARLRTGPQLPDARRRRHRGSRGRVKRLDPGASREVRLVAAGPAGLGSRAQPPRPARCPGDGAPPARAQAASPDLILSSPAVRALTTATIMARELKVRRAAGAPGRAAVPGLARGHARRGPRTGRRRRAR